MTITEWCVCASYVRQNGYKRINEKNDWGCGTCGRPTRRYYEIVMLPRDAVEKVTAE